MQEIETVRRGTARSTGALLAFGAITAVAAASGAVATQRSVRSPWYALLRKPKFQPPREAFGPVWTGLYALMAASAWRVWKAPASPERSRALALWGTQLALNAGWSWVFFGARRPKAALAELATLAAAIGAYANEARKVDGAAAWMVAPYLAWTGFAGALNEEIARKN
jgi:benzodiazapine receptor